jgi:hypothetical protein
MRAALLVALVLSLGCSKRTADYDPLAAARDSIGKTKNLEASVPSMCYTKTDGTHNPCWTCHTTSHGSNPLADWELQQEYSFSDTAKTNHWQNLFTGRAAEMAAIDDKEILSYIRQDNYTPLRRALSTARNASPGGSGKVPAYEGYVPDLDFEQGFDENGFARDGSEWRAIRYKPFPGTFWPTNGSTDDVFIRLPASFRSTVDGQASRAIYAMNLAILEAAIAADPRNSDAAIDREVEPQDEPSAGVDLDGDGVLSAGVTRIRKLPKNYAGQAHAVAVRRYTYPQGVEFLHSVRYVDPDHPALRSARMKELRYSRKVQELDTWALLRAYEKEHDEKDEGHLPVYAGSPLSGLRNAFGWQLQGFIEDAEGRLRLQTEEEHRFCMGCHSGIGVTVDQTFAFARKVPGREGFRHQDIRGIADVPQVGHHEPETLVYFRRTGAGDELRENREILDRFFPGGVLNETEVLRAAPGGDRDIVHLVAPSRERALLLDKAYLALVRSQRFDLGRDALPAPAAHVHARIDNGSTGLEESRRVYPDGRMQLDWGWRRAER